MRVKLPNMDSDANRNKINAIYQLREAVEIKAHAEHELEATGSDDARDALLAAQLDVEARTQDAIEVCHECGHNHAVHDGHRPRIATGTYPDNVIAVDFRREAGANDAEGA